MKLLAFALGLLGGSALLLALFNFTPLADSLALDAKAPLPAYGSLPPGFHAIQSHETRYSDIERRFRTWAQDHPGAHLTRHFRKSPWRFWRWYAFRTDPRYALPYQTPSPGRG